MLRSLSAIAAIALVVTPTTPTLAKPPGVSILGEVTLIAGEKSGFFTEVILPLGGNQDVDYGVYLRGYGDIGGDYPAGNAGGYVRFNGFPINQCGLTSFFGVTQDSQATGRVRVFCHF